MANKAIGYVAGDGAWVSGSILTNPADQTILVDTGPLGAGIYIFACTGAGSVAWVYDIQYRDSTNTINNNTQRRRPAAGNDDLIVSNKIKIAANERVRIILQGAITGEVQMSIFYQEVG